MSDDAHTSRWGHRALNVALVALGVALAALLYAMASQHLAGGGASSRGGSNAFARENDRGAAPAGPQERSTEETSDEILQVGVRNGCGAEGVAATTRGYLVREGFDVVEVGNYAHFDLDSSVVIDRVGNPAAARRVARAMGIPEGRVRRDVGEQYYLDASVVLGSDYRSLRPFQKTRARAAAR